MSTPLILDELKKRDEHEAQPIEVPAVDLPITPIDHLQKTLRDTNKLRSGLIENGDYEHIAALNESVISAAQALFHCEVNIEVENLIKANDKLLDENGELRDEVGKLRSELATVKRESKDVSQRINEAILSTLPHPKDVIGEEEYETLKQHVSSPPKHGEILTPEIAAHGV